MSNLYFYLFFATIDRLNYDGLKNKPVLVSNSESRSKLGNKSYQNKSVT